MSLAMKLVELEQSTRAERWTEYRLAILDHENADPARVLELAKSLGVSTELVQTHINVVNRFRELEPVADTLAQKREMVVAQRAAYSKAKEQHKAAVKAADETLRQARRELSLVEDEASRATNAEAEFDELVARYEYLLSGTPSPFVDRSGLTNELAIINRRIATARPDPDDEDAAHDLAQMRRRAETINKQLSLSEP